jgi:hypothetical protein
MGTWTEVADEIAPVRSSMTTRAGRWVTQQVGRSARSVSEVAKELGCDWHTVDDTVIAYGQVLVDKDPGAASAWSRPLGSTRCSF